MEITLYAKKRHTAEGKTFYIYLSSLTKKDGTKQYVSVRFKDDSIAPKPENCPMNIRFERSDANLSGRSFVRDGERYTNYTLWISKWQQGGNFVDHSLDEFI